MGRPRKDHAAPRVPMTLRASEWVYDMLKKESSKTGKSMSETANLWLALQAHAKLEGNKS